MKMIKLINIWIHKENDKSDKENNLINKIYIKLTNKWGNKNI